MPRSTTLTRALLAALAAGAVAAPTALARPVEDLPTKAQEPAQDFRMPDTYDAATRPQQKTQEAVKPPIQPDLRYKATTSSLAGTKSPAPASDAGTDSDTPWAEIGIGLAGLAIGGAGASVVTMTRRRSRVAA